MNPTDKRIIRWTVYGAILTVFAVVVVAASVIAFRTIGRQQALADARNRVKVSEIEIRNQEQRVKVAQQRAEIREVDAIGVRNAQDQIAQTLTPLYVQFEMVEALKAIAASGSNNSVVFVPAGANGIPLVYDTAGATKVGVSQDQ